MTLEDAAQLSSIIADQVFKSEDMAGFPFYRNTQVGDTVRLRLIEMARADVDLDRGQQELGHG